MKDRPEFYDLDWKDPRDYEERQALIKCLTCIDFNYPQHFLTWSTEEAKEALGRAGLVDCAVCLRSCDSSSFLFCCLNACYIRFTRCGCRSDFSFVSSSFVTIRPVLGIFKS